MNKIIVLLLLLPQIVFAQFGFQKVYDIDVIENNITLKYPWVGGLNYAQYSNIDLNFDGVQDLFVFDRSCNKILCFIQNGGPGQIDYEYAPELANSFPVLENWAILGDYNYDGKADILASSAGVVKMYKNTSTAAGLSFVLMIDGIFAPYNGANSIISCGTYDIPAFVDVDGDDDMDIFSYSGNSKCLWYYKNMSQELYGVPDSLEFITASVCYGNFTESNTTNALQLNDCCWNQVDNPQSIVDTRPSGHNNDRHLGSTSLLLDMNADNMMDVVVGDVDYNNLIMLINGGTIPNTDVSMISQDLAFPSNDVPVDLAIFPAAFHVDINNDQIRDLMVSPNLREAGMDYQSNWLYINAGADNQPEFELETKNFLQGQMIDHGSDVYPMFFDHDQDGLKDLIISAGVRFDSLTNENYSKLLYYRNSGTATAPEFTLMSDDYFGLSGLNGKVNHNLYATFGDLNGDGAEDMILSERDTALMLFMNNGGTGSAQFFAHTNLLSSIGGVFEDNNFTAPKLVDLNRDGLLDLVLGNRNGQLSYYENVGTATAHSFKFKTDNLGGVDVTEYNTNIGTAIPEFVDVDSSYHLIVGAKDGALHYYNDIEGNLAGTFHLVDTSLEDINNGYQSAPAIFDIDGDNKLEMFIGNIRGGLDYYKSVTVTDVGVEDYETIEFNIYPNPTKGEFHITLDGNVKLDGKNSGYKLLNMQGQLVLEGALNQTKSIVNCKGVSPGVYLLKVNVNQSSSTKKLLIE